jgi:hypothetical protein
VDVVAVNPWTKGLALIAGIAILSFALFKIPTSGERLARSVDVLLRKELGLTYTIGKTVRGNSITDVSARWSIILEPESASRFVLDRRFGLADAADQEYYKKVFTETLQIPNSLQEYRVYRAELKLGEKTICDNEPCGIEIVARPGQRELYVGIAKN